MTQFFRVHCRGKVLAVNRLRVLSNRSRYTPFPTMVVEIGGDPPPDTVAGGGKTVPCVEQ